MSKTKNLIHWKGGWVRGEALWMATKKLNLTPCHVTLTPKHLSTQTTSYE